MARDDKDLSFILRQNTYPGELKKLTYFLGAKVLREK